MQNQQRHQSLTQHLSDSLLQDKGLATIKEHTTKGGFGEVIFVQDQITKQKFAVKAQSIINQQIGQIDEAKLMFCKQESSILERVKHKNIVEYHSDYVIGFYHFLQMNLCEYSLDDWIQKRGNIKIAKSTFLHFLHQILDGIEHLHSQDYILRDLSTKNILITADGVVKLCDFGLAQQIDKQQLLASQIQSNNPKGVFIYFPPELIQQIENKNQKFTQSKTGDIWAFGICLSLLGGTSFIQASQYNQDGRPIQDAPLLDSFCNSIIKYILNANPKERPSISQIRKYIYDHLNSQQLTQEDINFQKTQQNPQFKNQQQLEEYYNQRNLEVPLNSYKKIEKQCLESLDKIESLLKLSQIYLHYYTDFEKAQQYVLQSLEKNADDPDVYLNQSEIYLMKFNYQQVKCNDQIEYFIDKASKICPNYWRIYCVKMRYCYFNNQSEQAYYLCQKGLELNKDNPQLLISQYLYQIKDNDIEYNKRLQKEAEETELKYIYYEYYYNLGYMCDQTNEFDKCVDFYKIQIQFSPNPKVLNNLGAKYQNNYDETSKAIEYYKKALLLLPYFPLAQENFKNLEGNKD